MACRRLALAPALRPTPASTGVDFIPPSYAGTTFTSAHEHYVPDAGGAFTLAIFQDAAAELREHGHEPPYEFLISPADETVVTAISPGFLSVNEALVNAGILAAQVNFSGATVNGKRPIGAISDFRVWVVPGMPDNYGFRVQVLRAEQPAQPVARARAGRQPRPATAGHP
jgi:hypothetical protein